MSLVPFDSMILYTVGYGSLSIAVSLVLWTIFADRVSTKPRKGQQHPMGWRNNVKIGTPSLDRNH